MMAEKKPTTAETESNTDIADAAANAEAAPAKPAAAAEPSEAAELKEKLLRTLAEMENLRRRTEREISDTRQYAVASFARDMLTVGDNLRRAIDSVPEEARKEGDPALKALIEGVEVTARGLEQTLAKFRDKPIDARGQKLDPSYHHAMSEVDDENTAARMVADVVQDGYAIGERVLRQAMVAVT
jgi:molecular chaperone GrpE